MMSAVIAVAAARASNKAVVVAEKTLDETRKSILIEESRLEELNEKDKKRRIALGKVSGKLGSICTVLNEMNSLMQAISDFPDKVYEGDEKKQFEKINDKLYKTSHEFPLSIPNYFGLENEEITQLKDTEVELIVEVMKRLNEIQPESKYLTLTYKKDKVTPNMKAQIGDREDENVSYNLTKLKIHNQEFSQKILPILDVFKKIQESYEATY